MDLTEKLRPWGNAYAAARAAERAAMREGSTDSVLRRQAQQLREHANQLHGDIYRQLDRR